MKTTERPPAILRIVGRALPDPLETEGDAIAVKNAVQEDAPPQVYVLPHDLRERSELAPLVEMGCQPGHRIVRHGPKDWRVFTTPSVPAAADLALRFLSPATASGVTDPVKRVAQVREVPVDLYDRPELAPLVEMGCRPGHSVVRHGPRDWHVMTRPHVSAAAEMAFRFLPPLNTDGGAP